MHEELTTSDELHYEEYLQISLENVLHSDQERMVGFLEDVFF